MIELRSVEQLTEAISRARAGRLFVQRMSLYRQYRVSNRETSAEYIVDFFVRNGKRYGCVGRRHMGRLWMISGSDALLVKQK